MQAASESSMQRRADANMPSMALETIVEGLTCAIRAIVENEVDIKTIGGKIC